ncbi:MAG: bifunctional riboflavin kinase/FAD synthetase [Acidobacteria bacterium]|nr:bifunctional riboflavin kinase/FAD synthetase [Acidobacteriota bacterium]
MRVLRSLEALAAPLPSTVVTVGNFDGVHRGHQRILAKVVKEARRRRGTAVALTFEPHPMKVLAPERAPRLLTTPEQKLALLEAAGLDLVLALPFTLEFSRLTPRAFVEEILQRRLQAKVICVGATFRFGHRHAGDARLLGELAAELGMTLHVIPPVEVRGQPASSSVIRRLVEEGTMSRAARLLGRPFALTGTIEPGEGRGRALGFPTLNFLPEQECLPARGVYVTETLVEGRAYPSATNVGVRPTFDGSRLVVECHLLDLAERVTGGRLEVRFYERVREEKRFPSPEALRAQIARDVERTRRFFRRRRRPAGRRVAAS